VNERDKPLALYVFAKDKGVTDQVLERTSSGGVCINATLFHVAAPALPFGGVGESGMGSYHGKRSFETVSHLKAVMKKANKPDPDLAYPPYTEKKDKLVRRFL
jgi:aldehyde dehydrogenase (NAD+)